MVGGTHTVVVAHVTKYLLPLSNNFPTTNGVHVDQPRRADDQRNDFILAGCFRLFVLTESLVYELAYDNRDEPRPGAYDFCF